MKVCIVHKPPLGASSWLDRLCQNKQRIPSTSLAIELGQTARTSSVLSNCAGHCHGKTLHCCLAGTTFSRCHVSCVTEKNCLSGMCVLTSGFGLESILRMMSQGSMTGSQAVTPALYDQMELRNPMYACTCNCHSTIDILKAAEWVDRVDEDSTLLAYARAEGNWQKLSQNFSVLRWQVLVLTDTPTWRRQHFSECGACQGSLIYGKVYDPTGACAANSQGMLEHLPSIAGSFGWQHPKKEPWVYLSDPGGEATQASFDPAKLQLSQGPAQGIPQQHAGGASLQHHVHARSLHTTWPLFPCFICNRQSRPHSKLQLSQGPAQSIPGRHTCGASLQHHNSPSFLQITWRLLPYCHNRQ